MTKGTKRVFLPVTINVSYPEFNQNMEKLMAREELRQKVASAGRGYGMNRSTLIQYLVQKEVENIGA
jgi:hypothetical protein